MSRLVTGQQQSARPSHRKGRAKGVQSTEGPVLTKRVDGLRVIKPGDAESLWPPQGIPTRSSIGTSAAPPELGRAFRPSAE